MAQLRNLFVDYEDVVAHPMQDFLEDRGLSSACLSSRTDRDSAFAFSRHLFVVDPDKRRTPKAFAKRCRSMEPVDDDIADEDFVADLIAHDRLIPSLTAEFQEIHDLGTGRLIGYEALTRLRASRALSPDLIFSSSIPIDLESAATVAIAEAAIRFSAALRLASSPAKISFNCSAAVLAHSEFPRRLVRAIDREGGCASDLMLELTENERLADIACLTANIATLKQFGMSIAIDDFGTGMSNFDRLTRLPVDQLKIDKKLFWSVVDGEVHEAMLVSILDHCRARHIKTVVEGVETLHHIACARAMGADFGQGYYWGRSAPAQFIVPYAGWRLPNRSEKKFGLL